MVVLGRADPSPGARGQLSEPGPARRASRLSDFGFLPALQPIAAALHGRRELLEVDLEGVEDVVRVVLGAEPDLALAGAGLLDDLLGLALGLLHDLLLGDQAHLLVAGLLEDAVGLALRLGEHLLALLHDPARLLDLLGNRRAHLVEDVVDLLAVDAYLVGERNGLRVVHEVVELVDENENVHWLLFLRIFGGPRAAVREKLHEPLGYRPRNQLVDPSAERGDLLHAARRDEADLRARHHVDGLDVGSQRPVQLIHLELPLEVRDDAEPFHDCFRLPLPREVDNQRREDVALDVRQVDERLPQERDTFVEGEHRLLVVRIPDHADDDAVEDPRRPRDHVDVAVRDWVVRPRADRGDHSCANTVTRVPPYLRLERTASGNAGSVRASVSRTRRPSSARTDGT